MKRLSFENHTVLLVLGLIFLVSGHAAFLGANILLFGSLSCFLRKKQKAEGKNKWLWLEINALLILSYFIVISFIRGDWYLHPVYTLIPSVIVPTFYLYTLLKSKKKHDAGKKPVEEKQEVHK